MSEISGVFGKDPLAWTAPDLELAIAYFQKHRDKFHLIDNRTGELKKVRKRRKAKAKQLDLFEADS
jgi:hypothetical protein